MGFPASWLRQAAQRDGSRASSTAPVVLLVVAEPSLRELLVLHLRAGGCYPLATDAPAEGQRLCGQLIPDLVLIDFDGLTEPGHEWARSLAVPGDAVRVPVLALAASVEHVAALAGHATLTLAKPVRPRDLALQVLRLLQSSPNVRTASRSRSRARAALVAGPIALDREQPTVRVRRGDQWVALDLPPTEHRLLEFLLAAPDRVRSRQEIRLAVWPDADVDPRTVDQYVRRLRRSLAPAGAGALVHTVRRAGYRVQLDALGVAPAPV